ncbi:MAG: hypothetical protein ACLTCP_08240 [Ruminococcus bicirculans (ex Wegman et al. 2014)]
MLYEIKNDKLSISADTFGAELHSIKLDGKEYLWQCGDAWKRYAPILFRSYAPLKTAPTRLAVRNITWLQTMVSLVTANLLSQAAQKIP